MLRNAKYSDKDMIFHHIRRRVHTLQIQAFTSLDYLNLRIHHTTVTAKVMR